MKFKRCKACKSKTRISCLRTVLVVRPVLWIFLEMELAIKLCIAYALYVQHIVDIVEAAEICKVPRGNAGTCIKITNCPPLKALDKKKHKTINEKKFIRQSICGYPNSDPIKVCCPSQSEWPNFQPNPIIVPSYPGTRIQSSNVQPSQNIIPNLLQVSDRVILNDNESTPDDLNTSTCGYDSSSGNKITNGDVTAIDQYPWLALLEYENNFLGCGGSLISKRYVLTAAHCIKSRYGFPLFIRLAEYNTTSYPTDVVETDGDGTDSSTVTIIATKKFFVHPDYSREGAISDIGLIEMERPVEFDDFIKIICIPQKDYMPEFQPSTFFYVAGWGSDNNHTGTEVKMETTVTYKTHSQCPLLSEETATTPALKICAGGEGGRDTCRGDSGGPLMYEIENHQYLALGIVSYGPPECGLEGNPAVYTYVYSYLEWIKSVLNGRPNNNTIK